MAKRASVGRINRMRNLPEATVQNIATSSPCATKPTTVYTNEVVSGTTFARLATFTPGSPGTVSPNIPISYLYVSGTFRGFLLGDEESGTALTNEPCPSGSSKVIVAAAVGTDGGGTPIPPGTFNISASLQPPATHIIMEAGARVELTWVPRGQGPGNYSALGPPDGFAGGQPFKGYWASGLVLSGAADTPWPAPYSATGPQAYLTTGSV